MKELRERARPLLFNGEGKPASILRVPTYHRLSRATVSSAPKDVAQDNENRYHKFAAEGAPGLQLDLAFEGAPGLQPDLALRGRQKSYLTWPRKGRQVCYLTWPPATHALA